MPVLTETSPPRTDTSTTTARVAVVRTNPGRVIDDYARVMDLADYRGTLLPTRDTLVKLNLSWSKYFPSCSSQPWQLDGVLTKMIADGFPRERLLPLENKTVVTDPHKGVRNNRWASVLQRHQLQFTALPDVEWQGYRVKSELLEL